MKQYPVPKIAKDVRAYLDIHSFYGRLIPNLVKLAKLLKTLTR